MKSQIQSIAIDKLISHPDNPNRMSKANFSKLVRNIEHTGRYEPLVVRPCHDKSRTQADCFQIINGYHRCRALRELGYKEADAIVWDIDEKEADILLATLNRLGGSDVLEKKLALLKRLSKQMPTKLLANLLPQTAKQIERLCQFTISNCRMPSENGKSKIENLKLLASPLVFFVNDKQQRIIEEALSAVRGTLKEKTIAAKNAAALTIIARSFLKEQRAR